jgi:hypothetical protein
MTIDFATDMRSVKLSMPGYRRCLLVSAPQRSDSITRHLCCFDVFVVKAGNAATSMVLVLPYGIHTIRIRSGRNINYMCQFM